MKVVEIFRSMQGEGVHMGRQAIFIRFAGCNLSCPFCDEHHKYPQAKEMAIDEIIEQCTSLDPKKYCIIVLTGGEPSIQPKIATLIDALGKADWRVHVETNGTHLEAIADADWITASPKGPDYKLTYEGRDYKWEDDLINEVKLVASDDLTTDVIKKTWDAILVPIWLQPCDGPKLEESKHRIITLLNEMPNLVRAGIQLHKWYEVV